MVLQLFIAMLVTLPVFGMDKNDLVEIKKSIQRYEGLLEIYKKDQRSLGKSESIRALSDPGIIDLNEKIRNLKAQAEKIRVRLEQSSDLVGQASEGTNTEPSKFPFSKGSVNRCFPLRPFSKPKL